jgi:hypothetical protein
MNEKFPALCPNEVKFSLESNMSRATNKPTLWVCDQLTNPITSTGTDSEQHRS